MKIAQLEGEQAKLRTTVDTKSDEIHMWVEFTFAYITVIELFSQGICRTLTAVLGAFQAGIQTQGKRRGTFQSESQISAPAGESYFSVCHEPAVVVEVVLKEIKNAGKEIEQWFGIIFRCGLIPIKILKMYS